MNHSKLYDDFQGWFTADSTRLSKKTVEQYLVIVKNLFAYMTGFNISALSDFSYESFSRFVQIKPNKGSYSTSSINQRVAALDIFFSWAVKERFVPENTNPVVAYKKMGIQPRRIDTQVPNEEVKLEILTNAQQAKLNSEIQSENFLPIRNHCIAVLILSTGLYAYEIVNLTIDSIDTERWCITIEKGGGDRKRKININSKICKKACLAWVEVRKKLLGSQVTPHYFLTGKLTPINRKIVYHSISQKLKKCGIHKKQNGPDILRQTAIFNMLKEGHTFEEVSRITGITTLAQLQKYKAFLSEST
ncbi:MAG: tyrosine-type recombinase/integrase [Gammaproteobacteria bacterium]|nr:tyrosine-type recombinase/integrase [Gammaproteobacteria bacterium]